MSRGRGREQGAATVEFVWLTVLLLVPLVYVLLTVFEAQRAAFAATVDFRRSSAAAAAAATAAVNDAGGTSVAFAVSSASQAAGRAFVRAPDLATAQVRAEQAAQVALADHGVTGAVVDVVCLPTPADCLLPGSSVQVVVTVDQPLPLLPTVLGESLGVISVDATHTHAYGTFREDRR